MKLFKKPLHCIYIALYLINGEGYNRQCDFYKKRISKLFSFIIWHALL